MAPSDNVKIVFGVFAAAGVVFVSYVFFRIFGTKVDAARSKKGKARKLQPVGEEKIIHEASTSGTQSTESQRLVSEDEAGTLSFNKDQFTYEDNSNQTSFIVVDQSVHESLPGDEGPPSSKKSDRSSDESSFDVVEAGVEEDDEEKKQGEDTLLGHNLEESLPGDNEGSMIILDSDPSGIEASSSSFYQSADETLMKTSKGRELQGGEESSGEHIEETEISDSPSNSGSEPTVMYSMEGKLISQGKDNDVIDISKAIGDIRDEYATGDEKKIASDPETTSFAVLPAESDESVSENTKQSADVLTEESRQESQKNLTSAETTSVLTICQNSPNSAKKEDIFNLVELLRTDNQSLQPTVLDCIVRVSAFTINNDFLCEAGCGWVMSRKVQGSCSAIVQGDTTEQPSLESLSSALTNLSMNPKFHPQLEGSVSPLIDVLLLESVPESVQLSTLRPLTNLSSESTFHHLYKRSIHYLYALLDQGSVAVRLQSLKVLVNLSLNKEMVPYLLSAKAPSSLLSLVDDSAAVDLILRTVTLIGNIYSTVSNSRLTQSSLPTDEKVESPYTMYTALCGVAEMPLLRNKVFRLTRHWNEDISQQASKLYHFIMEAKK